MPGGPVQQDGADTVHIHAVPEGLVILDVTWEAAPASVPLHPRIGQSPRTDFQVKVSCVAADVDWDLDIYYGVTDTGDVIYLLEDGEWSGFKYAVRDFDGTSEFWFSSFEDEKESHTYVELTASSFRAKFVRSDPPHGISGYFGGGIAQHVGDDIDDDDSWVALRSYHRPDGEDAESVYGILTYTEAKDLEYDGQYPQGIENLADDSTRSVAGYITPGHPGCLFADDAAMLSFFGF